MQILRLRVAPQRTHVKLSKLRSSATACQRRKQICRIRGAAPVQCSLATLLLLTLLPPCHPPTPLLTTLTDVSLTHLSGCAQLGSHSLTHSLTHSLPIFHPPTHATRVCSWGLAHCCCCCSWGLENFMSHCGSHPELRLSRTLQLFLESPPDQMSQAKKTAKSYSGELKVPGESHRQAVRLG